MPCSVPQPTCCIIIVSIIIIIRSHFGSTALAPTHSHDRAMIPDSDENPASARRAGYTPDRCSTQRFLMDCLPREWFLLCGWLGGRQLLARLQTCSCHLYQQIGVLQEDVDILHDVCSRHPLGIKRCSVNCVWMWMNLHATGDKPSTVDNETLIVCCPVCENIISHWLYAGVRYRYLGQLECAPRFVSEARSRSSGSSRQGSSSQHPRAGDL